MSTYSETICGVDMVHNETISHACLLNHCKNLNFSVSKNPNDNKSCDSTLMEYFKAAFNHSLNWVSFRYRRISRQGRYQVLPWSSDSIVYFRCDCIITISEYYHHGMEQDATCYEGACCPYYCSSPRRPHHTSLNSFIAQQEKKQGGRSYKLGYKKNF